MKRKLLPIAVAAGLTAAGSANAVYLNPEGFGEVLIYPFYTVENGQDTYINLANTTNQTKAYKVRVLEGMNSTEVLDFNLYLSPFDHWSAVITRDPNGEGAAIRTADTSCTVPNTLAAEEEGVPGPLIPFRSLSYEDERGPAPANTPGGFLGIDRTREGYVEVIEMGVLTKSDDQAAIKHVNGVPGTTISGKPVNCSTIAAHFTGGGKWTTDINDDITAPTGGTYGYGVLIDVPAATAAMYDATALDDFADTAIHFTPGDTAPSFANATAQSQVLVAGGAEVVFDTLWPNRAIGASNFPGPIDAVSSVMMHSALVNDYVLEPSIAAGTDFVVTFPTKFFYTNFGDDPVTPFTSEWDPVRGRACEAVGITYYDREERDQTPDPLDFSPSPEQGAFALCREANVMTINGSDVLSASDRIRVNLDVEYDNGWLEIDFFNINQTARVLTGNAIDSAGSPIGTNTFRGLPTLGFAVQKYLNNTATADGAVNNYAGLVAMKNRRSVSTTR